MRPRGERHPTRAVNMRRYAKRAAVHPPVAAQPPRAPQDVHARARPHQLSATTSNRALANVGLNARPPSGADQTATGLDLVNSPQTRSAHERGTRIGEAREFTQRSTGARSAPTTRTKRARDRNHGEAIAPTTAARTITSSPMSARQPPTVRFRTIVSGLASLTAPGKSRQPLGGQAVGRRLLRRWPPPSPPGKCETFHVATNALGASSSVGVALELPMSIGRLHDPRPATAADPAVIEVNGVARSHACAHKSDDPIGAASPAGI